MSDLVIGLSFLVGSVIVALVVYRAVFRPGVTPGRLSLGIAAFTIWWPLVYLQKLVFWPLWGDRGFLNAFGGAYGADKSMTNFVLEAPVVFVVAFVGGTVVERSTSPNKRFAASLLVVLTPLLVVLAIPGLGE